MSELPSSWVLVEIGSLCSLNNGRAFKPSEWVTKGLPIVRIQNLNKPLATYNYFDGEFSDRYHLRGGELLFAWSGTPGTSFGAHVWRGGEAVLNQHIFRVDFNETVIDKRFFRFAINQKLNELIDIAHGGVGLRHVTKGKFESTEIALAPLNEQKRIADKLDAVLARVDACRDRLDRIPTILKRFRQSVLAAATSGKLTEEWRESVSIGNTWRKTNVGTLLTDIRYGTSKKCYYDPIETPVIRIPNVCDGRVSHENLKYADFDDSERRKLSLVAGDILLIRSNGSVDFVGRTALVTERDEGFLYAGYLIRLRVNHQIVNASYLSLTLSAPSARNAIELTARSTSGVNNINTEEIKALDVELPDLIEQTEIVRRVEGLFAYSDRLEARYAAARAQVEKLTPATLAKAFCGELVPQDPNDEPASELLARIKLVRAENEALPKPKRGRKSATKTVATNKGNAMLQRKDIQPTHLSEILKERGSLTAESLWSVSQLQIDDFYDQLKDEEALGLLRESRVTSSDVRHLEAV